MRIYSLDRIVPRLLLTTHAVYIFLCFFATKNEVPAFNAKVSLFCREDRISHNKFTWPLFYSKKPELSKFSSELTTFLKVCIDNFMKYMISRCKTEHQKHLFLYSPWAANLLPSGLICVKWLQILNTYKNERLRTYTIPNIPVTRFQFILSFFLS